MHGFLWLIGVSPAPAGTPWTYQLWSGFIPALAVLSLVGGVWQHYKHVNCHVHRCWRVGRYDAGPYKVCRQHHPSDDLPDKVTAEHVREAYWAHDNTVQRVMPAKIVKP